MLLYDNNYILLGMSKDSLELFDFESFEDFSNIYSDIDELIINKKTRAHFIEEIINLDKKELSYKIKSNSNIQNVKVKIQTFFPTFCEDNFYLVDVSQDEDFSWIDSSLNKLQISYEEYFVYLKEFSKNQERLKNNLQKAIISQNKDEIKSIINDLIEPAKALQIIPIIKALDKLKTSFDSNSLINNYKNLELQMNELKRKVLKD